jgi:prepilin-type N-terminal cleavage/methylation domain-containing protein
VVVNFGSERGFTMVEILIVMVILGVLATLAIPNTRYIFSKDRLRASTTSVTSSLYLARMKAVNDGVPFGVQFNGDGSFYVVSDPNNSPQPKGAPYHLEEGITFGSNSFVNNLAIFNEYGQLDKRCLPTGSYTGTITISGIADSTKVEVTFLSGRIRETNR